MVSHFWVANHFEKIAEWPQNDLELQKVKGTHYIVHLYPLYGPLVPKFPRAP